MKTLIAIVLLWLLAALPAAAAPLFSGTDTVDYDVIGVKPFAIQGTTAQVLLIQSRAIQSKDYVVTLRSLEASAKRGLIAEVRFRDGQEEQEPYAVWLDSCFAVDGSLCNQQPPLQEHLTLAKLIEKIQSIYRDRKAS